MNEILALLIAVASAATTESVQHVFNGASEVTFTAVHPLIIWFNAIGTIVGIVTAIVGLFKIQEVHVLVNSRITELLKSASAESHAKGLAEGIQSSKHE